MIAPKEEGEIYENIKWENGKSIAQVNKSLWETWRLFHKHVNRKSKFHFGLNYFTHGFNINNEEEKWKEGKKIWKKFSTLLCIVAFRLWPVYI